MPVYDPDFATVRIPETNAVAVVARRALDVLGLKPIDRNDPYYAVAHPTLDGLTKADLQKMADDLGVTVPDGALKADLVSLVAAAQPESDAPVNQPGVEPAAPAEDI